MVLTDEQVEGLALQYTSLRHRMPPGLTFELWLVAQGWLEPRYKLLSQQEMEAA